MYLVNMTQKKHYKLQYFLLPPHNIKVVILIIAHTVLKKYHS